MDESTKNPDFDQVALPAMLSFRDAGTSFTPPSLTSMQSLAKRRQLIRTGVVTVAAAAVLVVGGLTFAALPDRDRQPIMPGGTATATMPVSPAASPSTSPSSSPSASPSARAQLADITATRWNTATVLFGPVVGDYDLCPVGPVTFNGGQTVVGGKRVNPAENVVYGDLNGDGRPEAAFHVHCEDAVDASGDGSGHLMVVTQRADGTLAGLGYAGPIGQNTQQLKITDGKLVATIAQRYGSSVQERTYRWNGTAFAQIAGPTSFPTVN
jgi:hypothetical protein